MFAANRCWHGRAPAHGGSAGVPITFESFGSPKSAAPVVRITAHYSHKRRRIAQGAITGFGGCGGRNCYFARAADQHPYARPVNAGCITFSATPVPDARSGYPTQELERNARTPRRRTHSRGCRTGTETPPPHGRIVACRGGGASAHSGDAA